MNNQKDQASQHRPHPTASVLARALQCALVGLSAAGSAFAQQVEAPAAPAVPADVTLPAVQVTATRESGLVASRGSSGTKSDTALVETPQSLSVISKEEIALRKPSRIDEAIAYTAGGVPVSATVDLRYDVYTLRGFAVDPFLDGLRLDSLVYGAPIGEPYGMERIEVLRGPASMLYGQASPGGLVNLVSKRPLATPLHEVAFELGNHRRRQGALDLGGAIDADGAWRYRLTALLRKSDSFVDYVEDNRLFIAPAVTWKPRPGTALTVLGSYLKDDAGNSGGTSAFLPASGLADANPNGQYDRSIYGGEPDFDFYKKKQKIGGYEFEHALSDSVSFRQSVRLQRLERDYQSVFGLGTFTDRNRRLAARSAFGQFGTMDTVATDNVLNAKFGSGAVTHNALVGLDYRRARNDLIGYGAGALLAPIDLFDPVYGAPVQLAADSNRDQTNRQRQLGVYAQDQLKVARNWLLTVGARWDHARNESINHKAADAQTLQTSNKTTGRAALSYLTASGLAPYLSYSSSFQPNIGTDFSGAAFKPTAGKQTEFGVKFQPAASNSLYTAALFDIKQENRLTADTAPGHRGFGVAEGEFQSRGLELEAKAEVLKNLLLTGAYTYLDAKITKSTLGDQDTWPHGVPRHAVAAYGDYRFADNWGAGLGARYVSDSMRAPVYGSPAITMVDINLHYTVGQYKLALNATNLFDRDTYDYYANGGAAQAWAGPGRQIKASLTYQW